MWKNLIIRRRHRILTLIEIVIPILLFFVVAAVRSNIVSSDNAMRYRGPSAYFHIYNETNNSLSSKLLLMYAPNVAYTDDIMSRFSFFMDNRTGK
jgi:hypothetical protein